MRVSLRPDPSRLDSPWWGAARLGLASCPSEGLAALVDLGPVEDAVAYLDVAIAVDALEWCARFPGWSDPTGRRPTPLTMEFEEV